MSIEDWRDVAQRAVDQFGSPLYLYRPARIADQIRRLKAATHGAFGLRYAVKTNPNPWLLRWLRDQVESLDLSSSGELAHARRAEWGSERLAFTGPAKTRHDLELAVDQGVRSIVLEDISEAELLNDVARSRGVVARALVRIAPTLAEQKFGVRLAGRPTQFGVDENELPAFFEAVRGLAHVNLDGFHIYSGSQCLDDGAMAEHFRGMWRLFEKAREQWGRPVSELVFGSGMGIPYHEGDASLSLGELAEATEEITRALREWPTPPALFVELGRFLVGEAGLFITRVIRVKQSRGTNIAICDGGMNNNQGACGLLGGVAHRHYVMANLSAVEGATEQYRLVGPLCTAIDTLAHRVNLPKLSAGDIIGVSCSGSYGPTASPVFFISHALPREIAVLETGATPTFNDVSWLPALRTFE